MRCRPGRQAGKLTTRDNNRTPSKGKVSKQKQKQLKSQPKLTTWFKRAELVIKEHKSTIALNESRERDHEREGSKDSTTPGNLEAEGGTDDEQAPPGLHDEQDTAGQGQREAQTMTKHHQDPMRYCQTTRREQTRGEYTYNRTNKTRYLER